MHLETISLLLSAFAATCAASEPCIPPRPNISPSPYHTGQALPYSPPRDPKRQCFVIPGSGHDRDDAQAILTAVKKCNNGGTVILDKEYRIGSPLDLTFLNHIDVVITGEIYFDDSNVYYWAENSFKYEYQNQSVFWKWGGKDVNIYGDLSNEKSVIDGRGQAYWEEIRTNKSVSLLEIWTRLCNIPDLRCSCSDPCSSPWTA